MAHVPHESYLGAEQSQALLELTPAQGHLAGAGEDAAWAGAHVGEDRGNTHACMHTHTRMHTHTHTNDQEDSLV